MNALRKIIRNCQQTTLLIEKQATEQLTLKEFFTMRFHLLFCSICRLFKKQSGIINELVKLLYKNATFNTQTLEAGFKATMQNRIDNELDR